MLYHFEELHAGRCPRHKERGAGGQWQTSEGQLRLGGEGHQGERSGLVTEVEGAEDRFDFESLLNGAPPTWQIQSPGWMNKRNAETNSCNDV